MQLPVQAWLPSRLAPGPGSQGLCHLPLRGGSWAGGGWRLALPVRWHREAAAMTEELAEPRLGNQQETVPGWVVSRGGRWQLLGSEGRKWRQGRDRKGGRQVGEEEEKKGKNWHFRGGLWLRPAF